MSEQAQSGWNYINEGRYKAVYIVSPEGEQFALGDSGDFKRLAERLAQKPSGRPPMWFVSSFGELIGEGAAYVGHLEAATAALRTQLAAAERKTAIAATMAGFLTSLRDDSWEVEPMIVGRSRELLIEYAAALSRDTGSEEGHDAGL